MKNELIELILTGSVAEESLPKGDESRPSQTLRGVVVGTVTELSDSGEPVVSLRKDSAVTSTVARSTLAVTQNEIGKDVVLIFEGGDVLKPIIIGILHPPAPPNREAHVDGEKLVFTADKEIVLKCGEASITLTRAGKVLIRGAYLSSRASGVNRIKGGSVQIN